MSLREEKKMYKITACNERKKVPKSVLGFLSLWLKTSDSVVFDLSEASYSF